MNSHGSKLFPLKNGWMNIQNDSFCESLSIPYLAHTYCKCFYERLCHRLDPSHPGSGPIGIQDTSNKS